MVPFLTNLVSVNEKTKKSSEVIHRQASKYNLVAISVPILYNVKEPARTFIYLLLTFKVTLCGSQEFEATEIERCV